ncbi:MAG: hypothetical protein ACD_62C00152G0003 [uncultured bacterium]|nr:MAG: hypothetical protein ACD_62C00152G0003 [uncultured bacterium]
MRPHLSINVKNLKNSVEFYTKAFGVKPQKQTDTYAKFDLQQPALNFSMHEVSENRLPSRVNHLGIEVSDVTHIGDWQKRLEAQSIALTPENNTDCCYARQDKIWFQDPDGNAWEVFFVHEQLPTTGAEPPKVKKVCGPASGCC